MLKLPKDVLAHANVAQLDLFFGASQKPIRPKGGATVTFCSLDDALSSALRVTSGTGHLVQGLEMITKQLDKELKGLRAVQEKTRQVESQRMSRLLFVSNDGSERYYHDVDSLVKKHGNRLWCCRIEATAVELGERYTQKGQPTKTLMIDDRKALGLFLSTLANALAGSKN
jgi:hypothetical protein